MRFLALTLALAAPAIAAEYPLWDGGESIAEYAQRAGLEPRKTIDLGDGVTMEFVLIPAGMFLMGTAEPEPAWAGAMLSLGAGLIALVLFAGLAMRAIRQRRRPQFSLRWLILMVALLGVAQYGGVRWFRAAKAQVNFSPYESPAHVVTISRPFYFGTYEVTQEQYQQVMGCDPSHFEGKDLPAEQVIWDNAEQFCRKVSTTTGEVVRLPREAEWEYACRAGTTTRFCSGDTNADLADVAWYSANSDEKTHPVGKKIPNRWGVYDMHGNVWEWCSDLWAERYEPQAVVDPKGATEGIQRILRGGAWYPFPGNCSSTDRFGCGPNTVAFFIGFRVVSEVSTRTGAGP